MWLCCLTDCVIKRLLEVDVLFARCQRQLVVTSRVLACEIMDKLIAMS